MPDAIELENHGEFTKSSLVLCEGKGDAAFFIRLLKFHEIGNFHVGYPDDKTAQGHYGKDGFGEYLKAFIAHTGSSLVKHIVIATDSDKDPAQSFTRVCEHIATAEKYTVPQRSMEPFGANPSITVLLIPSHTDQGNLETLLLRGVRTNARFDGCLDQYFTCCSYGDMPIGIASKKKLTTIVATWMDDNPSCSLANIWSSQYAHCNPIAIEHPDFKVLADFLRGISERPE